MTLQDFSTQFDILWNNVSSNQAPGLNEFEKSVFLTKAQSQLINEYFNNRTDGVGGGFDGTQRRQYDFSSLIKTWSATIHDSIDGIAIDKIDSRSKLVKFPEDYFLSVNESVRTDKYQYSVLAISYDEYQRLMLKPYAFPVKRAVWRLFNSSVESSYSIVGSLDGEPTAIKHRIVAELIGKLQSTKSTNIPQFILRYIEKPTPIILDDLRDYGEDVTIEGLKDPTPCKLPEETHQEILERAVTLAKIAWQGGTATQAAAAARQKDND